MDELLAGIDKEFCDSDGSLRIVGANWFGDELRFDLAVLMCEEKETELWKIHCGQVFDERLCSEFAETITLSDDSPLLIPYHDNEIQIAFAENNVSPNELFGLITSACYEIMGPSVDLSRFLNQQLSSKGICSSKYGILGRFPERIAKKLLSDLADHDIKAKMLEGFSPKYWTGSVYIPYPTNIKALSIGSSYIIGTKFSANQA
ncbi:hypothetical protein [Methylomonas sp. ZR1]|uniref:hypothetical protein n=1 Tax=Methylomonas sp. ZR1 TaxID=1797072 RepID=UPI001492621E|nr:hypothetical protein [Methylomonas sp. ZR1]NOV32414.1 hypothetical protein [Methylomonas sp. ZR1]